MGLNNNGLGFAFFGKDEGLGKQQKDAKKGFDAIDFSTKVLKNSLDALWGAFKGGSTLIAGLGLDALHGVGTDLENIANQMGSLLHGGINLTSDLETQLNASRIELRKMAVQAGLSGDAVEQFADQNANLAFETGLSAQQVGKAAQIFSRSGQDLKDAGIESVEALANISDVLSISPDLLEEPLRALRGNLELSAEATQTLVGRLAGVGKALGDVPAILETLPAVVEQLKTANRLAGNMLTSKQLAGVADQIQATTVAFAKANHLGAAAAAQFSKTLTDDLLSARDQYQGLFAGVGEDLGSFTTELGIATGDVHKMMALMTAGPQTFLTGLAQMYQAAVKHSGGDQKKLADGILFITQRMGKAMDPKQAQEFFRVLGKLDAQGLAAMANIGNVQADLTKMGVEGRKGIRTAQQEFEKLNTEFADFIKKAGEGPSKTKIFLDSFRDALKNTKSEIAQLAKKDGPLGKVANLLLDVGRFGALALIPEQWRGWGAAIGLVATNLAPMIAQLNGVLQLADQINPLMHPFNTAAIAVGALVLWFNDLNEKVKNVKVTLAIMTTELGDKINEATKYLGTFFSDLEHGTKRAADSDLFGNIGEAIKNLWVRIKPGLVELWDKHIKPFIKTQFDTLWIDVIEPAMDVIWGKLSGWIGKKIGNAFNAFSILMSGGAPAAVQKNVSMEEWLEKHVDASGSTLADPEETRKQAAADARAAAKETARAARAEEEAHNHSLSLAGIAQQNAIDDAVKKHRERLQSAVNSAKFVGPLPLGTVLPDPILQHMAADPAHTSGQFPYRRDDPMVGPPVTAANIDELEEAVHRPDWVNTAFSALGTKLDTIADRLADPNKRPSLGVTRTVPPIPKKPSYSEGGTGSRLPADMSGLPRSSP